MSEKETTTTTTTPPEAKASSTLNVNAAAFTPGKAPSTPSPPPAARSQPKPHTTQNSQPRFKQQQRQQQGPGGMPMPMPMPMPGGMMMGPNGPMPMPMPMPGPGGMMMGPNGPMPMPMPPPGMMPGPGGFPPGMFMGPPPPGMPMPPPGMGFPFPPGMAMPPNFMFPPGGKMPPPMGSPPRPNSGTPSRAKSSPHHTSAPPPHVSHSSLASASSGQPEMPRVSVGNAALAAVRSKEPPKFSCVLLSGIPAVGKTTLGRDLVNSLKEDGMGWAFFSGADFLQDVPHKRSVWETTQEVFDALSKRLDELIEQQNEKRDIKGLVIDKNCKGIEDVYYLNALLKSKNIPFVGIVGMECDKDDILIERMGGEQYLREKLKYHRVIHARIVNLAKTVGMYRPVDATKSKEEVVRSLRTMVLGCAAQPPSRGIRTHHYDESRANIMVDSFSEYCGVMNRLFECVPSRNQQFPVTTEFLPFSVKEMTEKKRVESLKHRYGVRSKVDGQRYILIFHNEKLYLVPPHMRAVLSVPSKAWLGNKLTNVGAFVLEGVLARLSKDRQKEKFLVYDALFWSDSDNTDANTVMRMDWNDRQECLRSHLCPENDGAFFPADTDCIIVHHLTHKMEEAVELLDSEEFTTDGLIFQPINPVLRSDHLLVWQQPSNITVDFRIGSPLDEGEETAPSPTAAGRRGSTSLDPYQDLPVRSYRLEVYDKVEKEYVQYEDATVAVRHPEVVPGCIVSCNLKDEVKRGWLFKRIRYDLLRPDYKHEVDDLLNSCLVPRAKLVSWLMSEKLIPSEIQKESPQKPRRQQQQNNNNNSNNNNGNNVNHNRTTATPTYSSVVRGTALQPTR
ncbi:hypothetical protein AGDE_14439 [Angomonas deanei]|uniref:mRNA capping enzyme, catalytic domain containing protein, putative n=1 Tax=Angomonas deanei TaxID=59799 RepID=A0A7G2CQE5_9TRYP|nr:hypothetical protein AGDE_14439 [Angomonas deanei]CAD2221194.1 mRNA capping enzyme, catalytic domain containing protein, putative [Angomonas deanei]|eukprot:EPY20860.1 hypothetical protein AGDE_14439 [Angomonas deanei]